MRCNIFFKSYLFPLIEKLFLPCSLFPVPCSLFPKKIFVPHIIKNRYTYHHG
ncbi:MAG: hypothetical protein F6K55_00860 [Moorea sp. SIO4A3]|nr:hypothetical protein [Moorena sp. SIO4A3]